jgi:hypothetical protein
MRAPAELAVARTGLVAAPPASTLEAWAQARGADGAPLLELVPEPVTSFDHEARPKIARARADRDLDPRGRPAVAAPALAHALAEARTPDAP